MKQIHTADQLDTMTVQQLNYCAAKIQGYKYIHAFHHQVMVSNKKHEIYDYNPCENPNRGYDIIMEHGIGTEEIKQPDGNEWVAFSNASECFTGPTPLHAAVKCYVAERGGKYIEDWLVEMKQGASE